MAAEPGKIINMMKKNWKYTLYYWAKYFILCCSATHSSMEFGIPVQELFLFSHWDEELIGMFKKK